MKTKTLTCAIATGLALALTTGLLVPAMRPSPRAASGLVFYLRGLPAGEERWTRVGDTTRVRLVIDRGPGARLQGTIVRRRSARAEISLTGRHFPWAAHDTMGATPAVTLPVATLAELATRLEAGKVDGAGPTVAPCGSHRIAGTELQCQAIFGLGWGATVLWRDASGDAAAAFIPTPLGPLVGVRPSRMAGTAADSVLSLAARATLQSIAERVRGDTSREFAIVGARIVTMAGDSPGRSLITDGTVIVRDGEILTVGAASDVSVPAGMRPLDGRGLTVLPGLWDSHAHLKQAEWLPAYLAAGVTTVRDLGSDAPFLVSLREAIDGFASPVAPRVLAAGFINSRPAESTPYTSAAAATAEEARALVRRYRDAGYELIKLWNALDDDVVAAAIAEARAARMRVSWHVPDGLSADSALAAGVDEINHVWSVLPFADAAYARRPDGQSLLQGLARRPLVVDPTLVVAAYQARPRSEPLARFEPCAAGVPPELARAWAAFGALDDGLAAARRQLRRAMQAVRVLHDAGVPIVAGSDQGIPGCTLVRELELYVDAGLTPFEALRSATVTPAQVAGLLHRIGTIEPGRTADLVVVAGDPLASISALRNVRLVVRGGRVFEPDLLRRAAGLAP